MADKFPFDCSPCHHPCLLHTYTITSLTHCQLLSLPPPFLPQLPPPLPLSGFSLYLVRCWPRAFTLTVPSSQNVPPHTPRTPACWAPSPPLGLHSNILTALFQTAIPLSVSRLYPLPGFLFLLALSLIWHSESFTYFLVCCLSPPPRLLTPVSRISFLFVLLIQNLERSLAF